MFQSTFPGITNIIALENKKLFPYLKEIVQSMAAVKKKRLLLLDLITSKSLTPRVSEPLLTPATLITKKLWHRGLQL